VDKLNAAAQGIELASLIKTSTGERPIALAHLLDAADGHELEGHDFSRISDYYYGQKVARNRPYLQAIYQKLVKQKRSALTPLLTNDDDIGYFHETKHAEKSLQVFCITHDQRPTQVVVISDRQVQVRLAWDRYEGKEYEPKQLKENSTTARWITAAQWLVDNYSDNYPGNEYVKRPDLTWYRQKKYVLRNEESSRGYVIDAITREENPYAQYSLSNLGALNFFLNSVNVACTALDIDI
jgi:hypothetical protein